MSGSFSNYAEQRILDHLFGSRPFSPLNYLYFGYMVGQPGENGAGAEPNGAGYSRIAVDNNGTTFAAATTQLKTNAIAIDFAEATAAHGNAVAIGVWDSLTGGNMLSYMLLTTPIAIAAGDSMVLPVGAFKHEFQPGAGSSLSNYAKNGILNHLYGAIPFAIVPMLHFGYSTTAPTDANPGTEPNAGAYARAAVANNALMFPDATGGVKANQLAIAFPEATAAQGAVTHVQVFDAASGGNYLGAAVLPAPVTIALGATPIIASQLFSVSLD